MLDGLKPVLSKVPHMNFNAVKSSYMTSLDGSRSAIEVAYQSTMYSGFANFFIAAAIIATIGLLVTLFIKNQKKSIS